MTVYILACNIICILWTNGVFQLLICTDAKPSGGDPPYIGYGNEMSIMCR